MNQQPSSEMVWENQRYVRVEFERVIIPLVPEDLHETARQILGDTLEAYSEPTRGYHTIDHIADCLRKLAPYEGRGDYTQLFLALLWHDLVYKTDVQGSDGLSNELLSAEAASVMMGQLQLSGAEDVCRLIIATKEHDSTIEDEALICAIDMSILAEPEAVYDAYAAGIRHEYGQYTDEQYRAGRLAALRSFQQPFYHPDFMHLTDAAYANIQREVILLSRVAE